MTELFNVPMINLFSRFGLTSSFWFINYETIFHTWIVVLVVALVTGICNFALHHNYNIISFGVISFVKTFKDLCTETLGKYHFGHTAFILTLFTFILLSNTLAVIPGLEEPTADLNTTLALGLTSFLYVQINSIRAHGFFGFLWEFFQPFFFMMPLNIVGELASIMSMSFRLFGNIFGGVIIGRLYYNAIGGAWTTEFLGLLSGVNMVLILFLGIFVGIVQAFVFSILSLTYLSLAIQADEKEAS